ncbi:hypothetical protein HHK36_027483 [Tetracentron sinense]|uniref:Uncharacterized protein n=1 Tax=Tetracentron sinense TaxID=13715 RepID=A0A834YEX9_TETSI|nr:hypothetical protein HHK36_027483 [Tetracentron sinense]
MKVRSRFLYDLIKLYSRVMGEEEVSASCPFISEETTDSLYPMYFGVSCAFVALELLSGSDIDYERWSETRDIMLKGSAHLLGLLVWRVQRADAKEERCELIHKLEKTKREVAVLKKMRSEDAKANEKVMGIFAAHEQCWLSERKKLQQQIGALLNEYQVLKKKKEEVILNLIDKIQDKELQIQSRDTALEEKERQRKELEEKLQKAEATMDKLRETVRKEAQEHCSELWQHKAAFIELVSNQRQLEDELSHAHLQVEDAKQELDSVFKQKEESVSMVQKLSTEIVKMQNDTEQKDTILSVMLRKSKLDTAEKQMLLKEVKISKARRKQAELETERWRAVCESKHERHSLRSNLVNKTDSRSEVFSGAREVYPIEAGCSQNPRTGSEPTNNRVNPKTLLVNYLQPELRNKRDDITQGMISSIYDGSVQFLVKENGEHVITTDIQQLEGWVRSETDKCTNVIEQRHHLEIEAFVEQMRLKDDKLEAFRWQLLSMELESKRLQSQIEGLNQNHSPLKLANMQLEALLLDREAELKSLKEKFTLQLHIVHGLKTNFSSSPKDRALDHETFWSDVEIIKGNREKEREQKATSFRNPQELETEKEEENPCEIWSKDVGLIVQAPDEKIEVEKEVAMDPGHVIEECVGPEEAEDVDKLASVGDCLITKGISSQKMDFHALGVSYKINRLKQQLLMLHRLAGMQNNCHETEINDREQPHINGFLLLISFLDRQVSRYQSLQEKIDDICKRMHENGLDGSDGDSSIARPKEETKALEHFLQETFQLQRYMVAAGQKLMEIQSRIASEFVKRAKELDGSASFDMRRFADGVGTLFREVQRGLEVRIARIIGDIEGTLACEGIIHMRN